MWEPSQATLDIDLTWKRRALLALRHIYFQGYIQCGGKGAAPGCAHMVGAQRYQAMKIQKRSGGWQYSMNSGPKGILIMPTYGKEILFLSCHPNLGAKSHSNSWRISSAQHEAKVNLQCHLARSWIYCIGMVI